MGFLSIQMNGSLFHELSLGLSSFILSNSKVLVLFYLIVFLFYYYPLDAWLFHDERQKGVDQEGKTSWEEVRRVEGGKTNQNILSEEKNLFSITKKIKCINSKIMVKICG